MARRMTRKILEAKVETFNSMLKPNPGLTLQAGFRCYNLITIDPETRRQYGSELSVYGLNNWEAAHYIDGLIHAVGFCRNHKVEFIK